MPIMITYKMFKLYLFCFKNNLSRGLGLNRLFPKLQHLLDHDRPPFVLNIYKEISKMIPYIYTFLLQQ